MVTKETHEDRISRLLEPNEDMKAALFDERQTQNNWNLSEFICVND